MFGNFARLLIVSGLICLSFKARGQSYIAKHYRGDTIALDTAVVMDLGTYRRVRSSSGAGLDLAREQAALNRQLEQRLQASDSLMDHYHGFVAAQALLIREKDATIAELSRSFDQVDATTRQALERIEKLAGRQQFWAKYKFWMGLAAGAAGTTLIMKQ